jgi:hypothetical protein
MMVGLEHSMLHMHMLVERPHAGDVRMWCNGVRALPAISAVKTGWVLLGIRQSQSIRRIAHQAHVCVRGSFKQHWKVSTPVLPFNGFEDDLFIDRCGVHLLKEYLCLA